MGRVTVSARLRRYREQVEELLDRSVTPPARSRRSLGLVATLRSSPPHLPHAVDDVQIPARILPCKRPDLDSGVLLRGATVTDLLATPTEAERWPRLRLASYPFRPRRAQRPLLLRRRLDRAARRRKATARHGSGHGSPGGPVAAFVRDGSRTTGASASRSWPLCSSNGGNAFGPSAVSRLDTPRGTLQCNRRSCQRPLVVALAGSGRVCSRPIFDQAVHRVRTRRLATAAAEPDAG